MAVKLNSLKAPKPPERAVVPNPNPSLGPVVSPRVYPPPPEVADAEIDLGVEPEDLADASRQCGKPRIVS